MTGSRPDLKTNRLERRPLQSPHDATQREFKERCSRSIASSERPIGYRRSLADVLRSPALTFPRDRYAVMMVAAALVFVTFDVILYFINPHAHWRLSEEDGIVENLTVVFWAVGAAYILLTLRQRRAPWLLAVLALVGIFVAGEEISWGQRIFEIATPGGLEAINEQHELTLHNIEGVHENIKWIGLSLILLGSIAIPFLQALSSRVRALINAVGVQQVRLDVIVTVVVATGLMALPRFIGTFNTFDEQGEMLLGLAFLLFALDRSGLTKPKRSSTPSVA